MEEALQHQETAQCAGLSPTGSRNSGLDGPGAGHALTIRSDHSDEAAQSRCDVFASKRQIERARVLWKRPFRIHYQLVSDERPAELFVQVPLPAVCPVHGSFPGPIAVGLGSTVNIRNVETNCPLCGRTSVIPDGVYKVHRHLSKILDEVDLKPEHLAKIGNIAQQIKSGEKSTQEAVNDAKKIKPGAEKIFKISGVLIPILVAMIAAWATIYAANTVSESTIEAARITADATRDAARIATLEQEDTATNVNQNSNVPIPQIKPQRKKPKGKRRAGRAKAKRKQGRK